MGTHQETKGGSPLRLIAFAEPPAKQKSNPIQLHVYIVNESPAMLEILNELDSINIPPAPQKGKEPASDADLIHVDFGVSGSATFLQVAPGECVRVTLLLTDQQLALLAGAKQMKTTVKFREGGDKKAQTKTVLLPAVVYSIKQS